MNNTPNFAKEDYRKIVETLALIAWKIELQENLHRGKAFKLAINTTVAVAENFAVKPFEKKLAQDLKIFLQQLPDNPHVISEFEQIHSVREKVRDVIRLFLTQAENSQVRVFANFLFRFASRLTEVSGQSFAGMGRKLDAGEAEILIEIRDELPR
jgi:plasmid stabilization system protein ParE